MQNQQKLYTKDFFYCKLNQKAEATCILFSRAPANWDTFKNEILTNASFHKYDLNNVSDYALKQIEKYVNMKDFNSEYYAKISTVLEACTEWVLGVYNYSVEKNRVISCINLYY